MKREFDPNTPEWMDLPQAVSRELEDDLANLRTLNRLFGGIDAILRPLRPVLASHSSGAPLRILDLATGSGDIPLAVASMARTLGVAVEIDAVDFQAATLEIARRVCSSEPGIRFHQGDIREFGDGRYWDIVLCSLALHHFSESDAIRILQRMRQLAERHAIVTDLCRSRMGTAAVDLLTAVWMRSPMTRNDARASTRRAFSFSEFAEMARAAGWIPEVDHRSLWCFRQSMHLRK